MDLVYQTPVAIPELGAREGDFLHVRPGAPVPLTVVRRFSADMLPIILSYLDGLQLVAMEPPVASLPARELLRRAVNSPGRLARPVAARASAVPPPPK